MSSAVIIQAETMVSLLLQRMQQQAQLPVYTFLEDGEEISESLSYAQFGTRVLQLAAHLQQRFAVGSRVLLLYPACIDYMVAFCACLCAGVIAVPLFPPRPNKRNLRLEAIAADCTPCAALMSSRRMAQLQSALTASPGLAALPLLCTDELAPPAHAWVSAPLEAETLAFLQYTSGSTGLPKGVMVSHRNLLENQHQLQTSFGTPAGATTVTWLPIYHDMGLIGKMLHALWLGGHCVFMAPVAFLQRPLRWLRAIDRFRAYLSGGPNFCYDLCVDKIAAPQRHGLDLSSWKVALNGAEPVRHRTVERFAKAFAPQGFAPTTSYPCYGMAEATLIISGSVPSNLPIYTWVDKSDLTQGRITVSTEAAGQPLVGCGRASVKQIVRVVNPATQQVCTDGTVGELWVCGPNIARGYWGRPEVNREIFAARIAGSTEGPFLRTGDLGFMDGGEIYITGRSKDVIIVRGANYYPQDIEANVEAADAAINRAGVAAFSSSGDSRERVVVVAEVTRTALRSFEPRALMARIRQQILEQHEIVIDEVVFIRPGTLPKSSSGKVQRSHCRHLYLSGQLALAGSDLDSDAA